MNFTFSIQNSTSSIGEGTRQELRLMAHPTEDPKTDFLCGGLHNAHLYMGMEGKLQGRITVSSILPSWVSDFQAAFPLVEVFTPVSRPESLRELWAEVTDGGAKVHTILACSDIVKLLHDETQNLKGCFLPYASPELDYLGFRGYFLGIPVIETDKLTAGWMLV